MKNKNSYEVLEAEVAKLKEENRHLKDERDELKYMLNDMHSVVDAANDDFFNEMSRLCGCIEIEGTRITAAYQDLVGILLANGYTVEVHHCIIIQDYRLLSKKVRMKSMSSAKKHKQRSHRSYRNSVATAEHFQNRQILKVSQQKAMKEKSNLFTKLMGLFKKGEK